MYNVLCTCADEETGERIKGDTLEAGALGNGRLENRKTGQGRKEGWRGRKDLQIWRIGRKGQAYSRVVRKSHRGDKGRGKI